MIPAAAMCPLGMGRVERSPFDAAAADYDATFSSSVLGGAMRRAVWLRLDHCFGSGDRVLDVGCGTGEDAVHLARRGVRVVATDRSVAMVEVARQKVADASLEALVDVRQAAIEDLDEGDSCDGVVSNFGALNCVADLPAAAHGLASCLRPGATAVLCVMGPLVPWEWLWFLLRGRPREAFRRLRPGGVRWRGLPVRYPSIRTLRRAFEPAFRLRRVAAIGGLLPPSYAEPWAQEHPWAVARLDRWERRLEVVPPLPWLADHYLAELELRSYFMARTTIPGSVSATAPVPRRERRGIRRR